MEEKSEKRYGVSNGILLAILFSFLGWCMEMAVCRIEAGRWVARGFLALPICPIYGFGVIIVTVLFRPISHTILPLFFATSLVCTAFELLVGLGMEKMFDTRWWDYSHEKFNYKGYICLKISILWGIGCVIVLRFVQPMVEVIVDKIPVKVGLVLIVIWSVLIVIDLISSICAVNKLNNRLKQIDEISAIMLISAQKLGGNLSQETLELKDKYDRLMAATDAKTQALKQKYEKVVDAADFKVSEWKEKYDKLMNSRDRSVERLLKAFPYIRSTSYSESMEALKRRLKVIYNKSKINSTFKEAEDTTEILCCDEIGNHSTENAEPETVQKM